MSTRYMKKVFGADLNLGNVHENDSDVEEAPTSVDVKKKAFNVYDLLNHNSDNEDQDENADEAECHEEDDAKQKKKKKKRKKKVKTPRPLCESNENEEIDEIDKTLKEVNELLGEPLPSSSTENNECLQGVNTKTKESILSVQHKHLNPFNELKRIFGSKTIQAEQSKRRSRGRGGPTKKTWLAFARDNWPHVSSGLSMSLDRTIESKNGLQYFVFEHSPSYMQTQKKFLQAVASLNPENIIALLNMHPYHVDSLLQMAELCKLNEDLSMSAEITERALYSLECAFHPLFNVTTANCRLDYRKQQNRALFLALFKHLSFVGDRACYRTSLEFCKLLLSLDPEEDPLAVVLIIDFYALRSREYEWFVEFCDLWETARNLRQLPNIAYSLALAHFHLGNDEKAESILQSALIMFPGVLIPLLQKCSVQADTRVMGHDYFGVEAKNTTPPALETLETLYVTRSYHAWKEADVLPWLERCVHATLDRIDAGTAKSMAQYCRLKRKARYRGSLPRNILRSIILSDLQDIVSMREIRDDTLLLFHDPLPPLDAIDIYTMPRRNGAERVPLNSNIFTLFFSSFININSAVEATAAVLNAGDLFYGDSSDDENAREFD